VDSRPSELDPYPGFRRDLGSAVLWERSLHRSQTRRERARRARRNAPRQKGVTLAAGAAILASPVLAPLASASSSHPGVTKTEISERAAASADTTALLSYGDTGDAVVAVQHEVGVVEDGIFGPITEEAVKSWQRGQGLPATGVVDARTWAGLFQAKVLFYDDSASSSSQPVSYGGSESTTSPAAPEESSTPASASVPDSSDASSAPSASSPGASEPAPVSTTPVSTSGEGCSTDGRIVTPVSGGTITSHYGEDRGDHVHSGTDIAVPTGATVRAADCGTVSVSGTESGYGEMVCVRHAGDTTTCYAHLSERDVSVNEYVKAGQKIGEVGCTGNCTGPHVHFEVRNGSTATNPDPYLQGAKTISGGTATMAEGSGGIGGATAKQQAEVFGDTGASKPKATLHHQIARPAAPTTASTGGAVAPDSAATTTTMSATQAAPTTPPAPAPTPSSAATTTSPSAPAETAPVAATPAAPAESAPTAATPAAPAEPAATPPAPAGTAPAAATPPAPAEPVPAPPAATPPAPAETAPEPPAATAPAPAPAEPAPAPAAATPPAPTESAPAATPPAPAEPAPAASSPSEDAAGDDESATAAETPAQDAQAAATGGVAAP
jgi:murein DD-endopeptidase MepM/ murein hydrolase activator NlpD